MTTKLIFYQIVRKPLTIQLEQDNCLLTDIHMSTILLSKLFQGNPAIYLIKNYKCGATLLDTLVL